MTRRSLNFVLVALASLIIAAPMVLKLPGSYGGTDDRAKSAIEETGYEPWFSPLWQPPSSEIASLLFALQAATGAGIVGYVIGRIHGQRQKSK